MTPLLNFTISFTLALIFHELGHLTAARFVSIPVTAVGLGWGPKVFQRNYNQVDYQLRLLPLGAFIRMDMGVFHRRALNQQLLVLGAGIGVNLMLAAATWGSLFSVLNLGLAIGNCIPLYQQDGWKGAIVVCRKLLGRTNPAAEWTITLFGGFLAIAVLARAIWALL